MSVNNANPFVVSALHLFCFARPACPNDVGKYSSHALYRGHLTIKETLANSADQDQTPRNRGV